MFFVTVFPRQFSPSDSPQRALMSSNLRFLALGRLPSPASPVFLQPNNPSARRGVTIPYRTTNSHKSSHKRTWRARNFIRNLPVVSVKKVTKKQLRSAQADVVKNKRQLQNMGLSVFKIVKVLSIHLIPVQSL